MSSNSYKNIQHLITDISEKINLLESKKLNLEELVKLHDDSKNLYERITILKYKLFEESTQFANPNQESKSSNIELETAEKLEDTSNLSSFIKFNFSPKLEEIVPENQTNLIDQIKEITGLDEHHEVLKEHKSINDKLSSQTEKISLAEKLKKSPISDIKSSIGLNQKFLFMNDLFEGEKKHYDEALEKLNSMNSYLDADDFIKNDLKPRFNWDLTAETTQQFIDIIERRYL